MQYSFQTGELRNSEFLNFHPEPVGRFISIQQLPQSAHCQVLCRKEVKKNSSRWLGKNNSVSVGEGSLFFNPSGFVLKARILLMFCKTKQIF